MPPQRKKPVKRISWKTEYYKLAKNASNEISQIESDVFNRRIGLGEASNRLDHLAGKYDRIAKKFKKR
jgi:hypothetical protein